MANFQSWGYQTKNVDFLLTNAPLQKLTLLVKILSDDSQIQNLPLIHLPIYKKIFISGLPSQKCGFFTNKSKTSKIYFVSKKSTFLVPPPRNRKFPINAFTNI